MNSAESHFVFPEDYPYLYDLMGQIIGRKLLSFGVPHARAQEQTLEMLDAIRKEIGGAQLYLSKGMQYELSLRDEKIYQAFRGDNYDRLARTYGLTTMQIRNIVRRARARDMARRQGKLF